MADEKNEKKTTKRTRRSSTKKPAAKKATLEVTTDAPVVTTTPAVGAQSVYAVVVEENPEWREKVDKIILLVQSLLNNPDFNKKLSWWWAITNLGRLIKFVTNVIKVIKGEDNIVVPASNASTVVMSSLKEVK
jgi:hypothetical protein